MVDRPPVSRDELGLFEIEFLLVAQGKYDGAVVVLALGGEMNGFRQLEHEVWRTGVVPFVRVVKHERRGRVGRISPGAAFVHPAADEFDFRGLEGKIVF